MINSKFSWAICSCCNGNGQVDNPAFSNGFTSSEWSEMSGSQQRGYLSGRYDVICKECSGSGKVQVPNMENLSFAEKRVLAGRRIQQRAQDRYNDEAAAERRMGC